MTKKLSKLVSIFGIGAVCVALSLWGLDFKVDERSQYIFDLAPKVFAVMSAISIFVKNALKKDLMKDIRAELTED